MTTILLGFTTVWLISWSAFLGLLARRNSQGTTQPLCLFD